MWFKRRHQLCKLKCGTLHKAINFSIAQTRLILEVFYLCRFSVIQRLSHMALLILFQFMWGRYCLCFYSLKRVNIAFIEYTENALVNIMYTNMYKRWLWTRSHCICHLQTRPSRSKQVKLKEIKNKTVFIKTHSYIIQTQTNPK